MTRQMHLRLEDELYDRLTQRAADDKKTKTHVVQMALSAYLGDEQIDLEMHLCHRCYRYQSVPGNDYCSLECADADHPDWMLIAKRVRPLERDTFVTRSGWDGHWTSLEGFDLPRGMKSARCVECGTPIVDGNRVVVPGGGVIYLPSRRQTYVACLRCAMPVGEKDLQFYLDLPAMTPAEMREKYG